MHLSEGKGEWSMVSERTLSENGELNAEKVYSHISICAPYLEVVEEMTLNEFLNFHHGFKPFLPGLTNEKIISILGLEKAVTKQIRYYSSGMKQRVKLAQAIFSDVPLVLLDEPCTNFDKAGFELYYQLINDYCKNRLVVVSSNDEMEYGFCEKRINISDYKK
jgi:ABC-type multidrug transport system ATPase subunit